ncbi:MAG: UDP-glucose/GDP-mannose dehydrogenase family protein [Caldilineaceae bacterium]
MSDIRESPALDMIHLLEEKGAQVRYHDPHVPAFQHDGMEMVRVASLDDALATADCVVLCTDHTAYQPLQAALANRLLVDTRRVDVQANRRDASTLPADLNRKEITVHPTWPLPRSRRGIIAPPRSRGGWEWLNSNERKSPH